MNQRLLGFILILASLIPGNPVPVAVLTAWTGLFLMFTREHIAVEEE